MATEIHRQHIGVLAADDQSAAGTPGTITLELDAKLVTDGSTVTVTGEHVARSTMIGATVAVRAGLPTTAMVEATVTMEAKGDGSGGECEAHPLMLSSGLSASSQAYTPSATDVFTTVQAELGASTTSLYVEAVDGMCHAKLAGSTTEPAMWTFDYRGRLRRRARSSVQAISGTTATYDGTPGPERESGG